MHVADFMTPEPFCVHRRERLSQLVEVFEHHGVFQIPVIDDSNVIVGIVSNHDVGLTLARERKLIPVLKVEDIMTANPITVSPSTPITDAIDILCESRFGALPVVVNEHVVGILSARDLLRRFAAKLRESSRTDVTLSAGQSYALGTRA